MKTHVKLIMILPISCIIIGLFNSCDSFDSPFDQSFDENVSYYQFEDEDLDKLISTLPNEGQRIVYKNQFDEELQFTVIKSKFGREACCYTGFFEFDSRFTYDRQLIEFRYSEEPNDPNIYHTPSYSILIAKTISGLQGGLNFPLSNNNVSNYIYGNNQSLLSQVDVIIDFELESQAMTIGSITYDNVLIFDTMNEEPVGSFYGLPGNVHMIYYDISTGIVGFDDLDGNEWCLK